MGLCFTHADAEGSTNHSEGNAPIPGSVVYGHDDDLDDVDSGDVGPGDVDPSYRGNGRS